MEDPRFLGKWVRNGAMSRANFPKATTFVCSGETFCYWRVRAGRSGSLVILEEASDDGYSFSGIIRGYVTAPSLKKILIEPDISKGYLPILVFGGDALEAVSGRDYASDVCVMRFEAGAIKPLLDWLVATNRIGR